MEEIKDKDIVVGRTKGNILIIGEFVNSDTEREDCIKDVFVINKIIDANSGKMGSSYTGLFNGKGKRGGIIQISEMLDFTNAVDDEADEYKQRTGRSKIVKPNNRQSFKSIK